MSAYHYTVAGGHVNFRGGGGGVYNARVANKCILSFDIA